MSQDDKRSKILRFEPRASSSSRFDPAGIEWVTKYARKLPPQARIGLVLGLVRIILEELAHEPSIRSTTLLGIRTALSPQILAQVEIELLEGLPED